MEGVGSRLGRASSRYGSSTTTAVFNGPVRKWKRKWVHVSPSPLANNNNNNHNSSLSNGHHQRHNVNSISNNAAASRILLFRWTPLSPAAASDGSSSDEPPKRKFRYTPIALLEEQRKAVEKVEDEDKTSGIMKQSTVSANQATSKNDELNVDQALKNETQESNTSNLDLGLCLQGPNSNHESDQRKESLMNKTTSGGFWTIG